MAFVITTIGFTICSLPPLCKVNLSIHKNRYDEKYACSVTAITVYELLFGVARAKKEIGEQALLGILTVLPLSDAAARRAANLHADLISRNQDIGIKDVLIAAICLEHTLPILTANHQHFSRVSELKVIRPSELVNGLPNS